MGVWPEASSDRPWLSHTPRFLWHGPMPESLGRSQWCEGLFKNCIKGLIKILHGLRKTVVITTHCECNYSNGLYVKNGYCGELYGYVMWQLPQFKEEAV